jgi:hypothetical protein
MKYRQPGYRDNEYKEEREGRKKEDHGPRPPREPRGMAREAFLVRRCFQCGQQEPASEPVKPGTFCPKCKAPEHCCRNCVHFDPGARFECKENIPVKIMSKTNSNECVSFRATSVLDATGRRIATVAPATPGAKPVSPGRAAFEALFKKT